MGWKWGWRLEGPELELGVLVPAGRWAVLGNAIADSWCVQALQNAVDRLSKYVGSLEEKMEALERKKK